MRLYLGILLVSIFCACCIKTTYAQKQYEIFLTPMVKDNKYSQLMVINNQGDTLKHKRVDSQVLDFKKHVINGKTRYSYFLKDDALNNIGQKYHTGYRIITDTDFNELQRITIKSHGIVDAKKYPAVEHHDFILLSDNHYIVATYYEHHPNNIPADLNPSKNIIVVSPVIQEVKNEKVIWQWVATEHPEFYYSSMENNNFSNDTLPADYLHINAMFIDPKDNNIIVSFRDASQVVKLNRKGNNVIWKLGGKNSDFVINDTTPIRRQHNVTMVNNGKTIMMIDNGKKGTREYSRVVEIDINENKRIITGYRTYNIPGKFIEFGGSVQKSGDNYFIGGGSGGYIIEVNPGTGVKSFEFPLELGTYRAYRYEKGSQ